MLGNLEIFNCTWGGAEESFTSTPPPYVVFKPVHTASNLNTARMLTIRIRLTKARQFLSYILYFTTFDYIFYGSVPAVNIVVGCPLYQLSSLGVIRLLLLVRKWMLHLSAD